MNFFWLAVAALLLDRIVGDPTWMPHPVVMIGKWIGWMDKVLNHPESQSNTTARLLGLLMTLSTLILAFLIPWLFIQCMYRISPILSIAIQIALISTTIAWKGLIRAGQDVRCALDNGGIVAGRQAVSMIVGRDTDALPEGEVIRASVETLAENIVDAVVSPVVFACIGGAPLAFLYRAVNTMDSMVGYKNDRYKYFGWASARLDDVLNYIPARITAALSLVAVWSLRLSLRGAWRALRNDAHKHPSPNSGIPESIVAGALQVQLGGTNYYKGIPSHRATMGFPTRMLEFLDIQRTIQVVNGTSCLLFILVAMGGIVLPWF